MRRNRFGCSQQTFQNQTVYQNVPTAQPCMGQQVNNMGYNKTTYEELAPIMTCSKNIVNEYHIVKQPYIHTYHTEVVHHHVKQNEYIPQYTTSEVHIQENNCCN